MRQICDRHKLQKRTSQAMEVMNVGAQPRLSARGPVRVAGLLRPRRPLRPPSSSKHSNEQGGETGLHDKGDSTHVATSQGDGTRSSGDMQSMNQFGQVILPQQITDMSQCSGLASHKPTDAISGSQTSAAQSGMHRHKDLSGCRLENSAGRLQAILREQERRRAGTGETVMSDTTSAAAVTSDSNFGSGSIKQEPGCNLVKVRIKQEPVQSIKPDPDNLELPRHISPVRSQCSRNELDTHPLDSVPVKCELQNPPVPSTSIRWRSRSLSTSRRNRNFIHDREKMEEFAKCMKTVPSVNGGAGGEIEHFRETPSAGVRESCRKVLSARENVDIPGRISPGNRERKESFGEKTAARAEGRKSRWDVTPTSENIDTSETERSEKILPASANREGNETFRREGRRSRWDVMPANENTARSEIGGMGNVPSASTDKNKSFGEIPAAKSGGDQNCWDVSSSTGENTDRSQIETNESSGSVTPAGTEQNRSFGEIPLLRNGVMKSHWDVSTSSENMEISEMGRSEKVPPASREEQNEHFREVLATSKEGRKSRWDVTTRSNENVDRPATEMSRKVIASAKARAEKMAKYQISLCAGSGKRETGGEDDRGERDKGDMARTSLLEMDSESNTSTISSNDCFQLSLSSSDTSLRDESASQKKSDASLNYLKLELPGQYGGQAYTLTLVASDMSNLMDIFSVLGSAREAKVVSSGLNTDALLEEIGCQTGLPVTTEKLHDLPQGGCYSPQALLEVAKSPLSYQIPRGWNDVVSRFESFNIDYILHQWGHKKYFKPSDHCISHEGCARIFRCFENTTNRRKKEWEPLDKQKLSSGQGDLKQWEGCTSIFRNSEHTTDRSEQEWEPLEKENQSAGQENLKQSEVQTDEDYRTGLGSDESFQTTNE